VKIKDRIALQFTVIVATLLVAFSMVLYTSSAHHRQEEFYERLKNKARTTCRFLAQVQEVDTNLLKIIDRNTLTALIDEKVLIFDKDEELIYSSVDDKKLTYRHSLLQQIKTEKYVEIREGDSEVVGLYYDEVEEPLVVLASAYDKYGLSKLENLREVLLWGLFGGITLTIVLGVYFAGNSLQPIALINNEVSSITANNLRQRLSEGNRHDEIAQLAMNFNKLLDRLELAFAQQRDFVSHASHELRTPLAAIKSELQLSQRFVSVQPEIKDVFANLNSDTERLINITNSLLFLARSFENKLTTDLIRIEDVLFHAREELLVAQPGYSITINYLKLREIDSLTLTTGNEELLQRVFKNLMDNACKYSDDHAAKVTIDWEGHNLIVAISDNGMGISREDLPKIFDPFFRANNAKYFSGYGIGLSICQRIIDVHGGALEVVSEPDVGSTFTVALPRMSP
jgi:signal transduction histidine kinase